MVLMKFGDAMWILMLFYELMDEVFQECLDKLISFSLKIFWHILSQSRACKRIKSMKQRLRERWLYAKFSKG